MDRVSKDTRKLIEDLRTAVDDARKTRENTQRLLLRREAAPQSEQQPTETERIEVRLHLQRIGRW